MSTNKIRTALATKLATLDPFATQGDNKDYTPVNGTPYQIISIISAQPENPVMGGEYYRERGIFQVQLRYPSNTGTSALYTRAELIQSTFKRGTTLTYSGVKVIIDRTPYFSSLSYIADRVVLNVSISYYAHIEL